MSIYGHYLLDKTDLYEKREDNKELLDEVLGGPKKTKIWLEKETNRRESPKDKTGTTSYNITIALVISARAKAIK